MLNENVKLLFRMSHIRAMVRKKRLNVRPICDKYLYILNAMYFNTKIRLSHGSELF